MIWMLWALMQGAVAEEFHVVRQGETVESIAEALGDAAAVEAIRANNNLDAAAQPAVGSLLRLPQGTAGVTCQPSYIISHYGEGLVRLPGKADKPISDYQPLPAGTVVCTSEDSFASVRMSASLDDRTFNDVTLMPSTCVEVRTSYVGGGGRTSMLALSEGEVNVLKTGTGDSQVVVQTESGVALGEEGGFRVAVETDAMRTEAVDAGVSTMAQGEQVDLDEGFGNRVVTGEAPGPPVALLEAGALLTPPDKSYLRRHDFGWVPVPRAVQYLFEVSRTPNFDQVVLRTPAIHADHRPENMLLPLDATQVYWRVISVDRTGFRGIPSDPFTLLLPSMAP